VVKNLVRSADKSDVKIRGLRRLIAVLLGAAAYYGAARMGYAIAFVHGTVSAVWPPTGVALALVWIGGPRMLPAVFLGELTGDLTNGTSLLVSIVFACGSTCEALAGYGLLRLTGFRRQLDRPRDVFSLLVLTAVVSTMASATIGTVALLVHGDISTSGLWSTWRVWWLGDMTGDVVVAPLLLVLAGVRPAWPRGWRRLEWIAFAATLVTLALVAHQLTLGIAYLVLPVLIWAALRFGQTGAVLANAVLAGAGVIGAAGASTQLARVSVLERILFTQNFVSVGAITTLVLAALISERNRATQGAHQAEARASALAAERSALGLIATSVAREEPIAQVLGLVVRHATLLLGARGAHIDPGAGGAQIDPGVSGAHIGVHAASSGESAPPAASWVDHDATAGPFSMRADIKSGSKQWGELSIDGIAREPDEEDCGLVERLADLAGLAVTNAAARARLLAEATTDPLTGLVNQRAFRRRLGDEIERSERYGRPLALILLDLDEFKAVNDAYGHLVGDDVLAEVGRRIVAAVRADAMVARMGGDELVVLLPECDGDGGYLAADRVREAVAAEPISAGISLTLSAGVATLEPDGDLESLLRDADAALYAAKRLGGNSTVRFTGGLIAGGLIEQSKLSPGRPSPSPADAAQSA
jgi:diguanylate cyclase (GGDEF)-like protein